MKMGRTTTPLCGAAQPRVSKDGQQTWNSGPRLETPGEFIPGNSTGRFVTMGWWRDCSLLEEARRPARLSVR